MSEEELRKLPGIGKEGANKLIEAGFDGLEKISNASSDMLSQKVEGVNIAKAQKMIADAHRILQSEMVVLETAKNILKFQQSIVQRISTGSSEFDNLLGGGIQTDAITLFGGAFGTGKSQVCYQVALNSAIDLKRPAVYLEAEPLTFKIPRLIQMSVLGKGYVPLGMNSKDLSIMTYGRGNPKFVPTEEQTDRMQYYIDNAKGFLNLGEEGKKADIYGVRADFLQNTDKLYDAYVMVAKQLLQKGVKVGVIVIDSFTALFRKQYAGRGQLSGRSEEFGRHIGALQKISSKYNLAVVLTSQVYGIPDPLMQGVAKRRFGISRTIYGGDYFLHSCTYQVSLKHVQGGKVKENVWEAYVFDAPDLPKADARFILCPEGVRDEG